MSFKAQAMPKSVLNDPSITTIKVNLIVGTVSGNRDIWRRSDIFRKSVASYWKIHNKVEGLDAIWMFNHMHEKRATKVELPKDFYRELVERQSEISREIDDVWETAHDQTKIPSTRAPKVEVTLDVSKKRNDFNEAYRDDIGRPVVRQAKKAAKKVVDTGKKVADQVRKNLPNLPTRTDARIGGVIVILVLLIILYLLWRKA